MAENLVITGSGRSKWRVGSLIGSGAFGKVYELLPALAVGTGDNNNAAFQKKWVIKVCPSPKGGANNKQAKKEVARVADMLFYEALMYRSKLPDLQGTTLPYLPGFDISVEENSPEPPVIGDDCGFRYLVMERMKASLFSLVPMLTRMQASAATKKIDIGPIVARLIEIVEQIHRKGYLLIDVKPENFMFVDAPTKDNIKSTELASRLRLLDLGLLESYKECGTHRPNVNHAELVGTPLYASLNVHNRQTHSRRDDLEAVGYVVAELVIRFVAALKQDTDTYEKSAIHSYLPWSLGTSDAAVAKVKAEHVSSQNSSFFTRMGQGTASQIVHQFLTMVRHYSYKQVPDYQALRSLLLQLTVETTSSKPRRSPLRPCVAPAPPTTTATKPAATRTSNRRKHHSEDDFEYDEDAPRRKKPFVCMGKSKSPKPSSLEEKNQDVEDMDTDVIEVNPNESIVTSQSSQVALPSKRGGLLVLEIKDGPRTGQRIELKTKGSEVITIGTGHAASSNTQGRLELFPGDPGMAPRHARLQLQVRRGMCSLKVVDLKTTEGTFVNSSRIPFGKDIMAFPGDTICAGETILLVRRK